MSQYIILPPMHPRTWLVASSRKTMGCVRTLGSTASAPGISPHWHSLALLLNVLEVGQSALELPAVDGLRGLPERSQRVDF
jgi:hypothetical protein